MRRLGVFIGLLAVALVAPPAAAGGDDFAYDILPPGQFGGLPATDDSTDQLPLYDALTPLRGEVTEDDIRRLFKREDFAPNGATTEVATGRPGLRLLRDSFGVPHIYGETREDTWFGAGYATGQDRALLLTLGRGPARAAVADIPGVNAFGLITSGRSFVPSPQAEALVTAQQDKLVEAYGDKGRQILRDLAAYADGITAAFRDTGSSQPPWTVNDVLAVNAFIGSIFGNGGGDEVRNSEFLAKLRAQLGPARGGGAFVDLMAADDADTPTTLERQFRYGSSGGSPTPGSPLVDPGSIEALPAVQPSPPASNYQIVSPSRSATGESLFVGGPQLGYFYPAIVLEASLHGPGLLAQGALVPGGGPYVLIGRTRDYAWSLKAAGNDNRDQFLEELCEPDGSAPTRESRHYRYRGECRPMEIFDAGLLDGDPVRYPTTVHGQVSGTATVEGTPYAISRRRSTFGEDGLSLAALRDMTLDRGRTVPGFYRSANQFGFTFHWGYAGRRQTAFFSSGKLPRRAPGTNKLLPTLGTGDYDWRGFLSLLEHPHGVSGPDGLILNWNNKPAPGWQQGDSDHSHTSVHRVEMYDDWSRRVSIEEVVSVANRAATEDLRATEVWPVIERALERGSAPDERTARAAELVGSWSRAGGSRLDSDRDGRIDDPGAAVMDASWDRLADAVLSPVLGQLLPDLAALHGRDNAPYRANGSAFGSGWYGYVDKDLRGLLGLPLREPYNVRYCGNGSLEACSESLWAALKAAGDELAAAQGPDPAAWRSDAIRERIRFLPGLIPNTMRWTNRPTFQQVLRFARSPDDDD